ncbi:MAG: TlpA disulfide reductase family protein [Betaproteobacteria bacterium]
MSPLDAMAYPDLAGKPRRIAEWRGKVVAVNFWATWCAPCREEIPMFMEVRRERGPQVFEIVGIAIDSADKVAEYARNVAISYPVLVADGSGLDLIRKLGNTSGGLPYTAFLDRDGRPVRSKLGAFKRSELDALLAELLP